MLFCTSLLAYVGAGALVAAVPRARALSAQVCCSPGQKASACVCVAVRHARQ
jgi:hypothetical protein